MLMNKIKESANIANHSNHNMDGFLLKDKLRWFMSMLKASMIERMPLKDFIIEYEMLMNRIKNPLMLLSLIS